jgi:hypothetical protein
MRLNTSIYDPATLTGVVRASLETFFGNENRDVFSEYLPNEDVRDIEFAIRDIAEFDTGVAGYRTYDAESPIGDIPELKSISGRIPPISEKVPLGEYDTIRADQAGDLNQRIERLAVQRAIRIARRVAKARVEALVDGKVSINENGVIYEIDFGRNAANTKSAAVGWDSPSTGDPVADLLEWYELVEGGAASIRMAPDALAAALKCAKVINATIGSAAGVTQANLAQFNGLLDAHGLPPAQAERSTIGGQQVMGSGKIVFLPAPGPDEAIGVTLWGETAEARLPEWGLSVANGEGPGIVSGVYSTEDPVRNWVKSAAIAVPVVGRPNATLSAQVLTGS